MWRCAGEVTELSSARCSLMLFVFSYSEQIVSAVFPVILGPHATAWRIAVVVVDLLCSVPPD